MEMSRGWQELGVVDTIYEDDHEEEGDDEDERFDSPTMSSSAATSRSCSPEVEEDESAAAAAAHASLPPALRRAVQAWYLPRSLPFDLRVLPSRRLRTGLELEW